MRAGTMSLTDFMAAESGMSRTPGTCMTMGTASTTACLIEAMGVALPGNAMAPAVDATRRRIGHESGRLIVKMARSDLRLSQILTRGAFENAIRALGWQGKYGPNGLFVWAEGVSHPVDHDVSEDVYVDEAAREKLALPAHFVIYSYDCSQHYPIEADCYASEGVWIRTTVRPLRKIR
jgi:Dehydratase family